jgi:hypothetical protein
MMGTQQEGKIRPWGKAIFAKTASREEQDKTKSDGFFRDHQDCFSYKIQAISVLVIL